MTATEWVERLFASIDNCDTDRFAAFLSEDVRFRFGNAETAIGKSAVAEAVQGFFDSIHGLQHELLDVWERADAVICHGNVTYTRHDSSALTVPFATVFKMSNGLIREYLIFADVSQLYTPA